MLSDEEIMQQAMVASTSAGGSLPITSSAVALAAYMPPNISNEEMIWHCITESANEIVTKPGVV
jgi:hypothetical protein